MVASFLYTLTFFPETLSDSIRTRNQHEYQSLETESEEDSIAKQVACALKQPFKEMKILNRNFTIRLVAIASFFSSMVYSTDVNLVIFYIEEHLDVRANDIARMFFVMGVVGIVFQAVLLQPMVNTLGEKGALITSFISGTIHNFLYGIAQSKGTIYVALCFSQLTKTNTPVLASLASNAASESEQGQLQGAFYAVNALSAAIGPLVMQYIYDRTKDSIGPGTMFVFAAFLYFVGTMVVSFIPTTQQEIPTTASEDSTGLNEPLLLDSTKEDSAHDESVV